MREHGDHLRVFLARFHAFLGGGSQGILGVIRTHDNELGARVSWNERLYGEGGQHGGSLCRMKMGIIVAARAGGKTRQGEFLAMGASDSGAGTILAWTTRSVPRPA